MQGHSATPRLHTLNHEYTSDEIVMQMTHENTTDTVYSRK